MQNIIQKLIPLAVATALFSLCANAATIVGSSTDAQAINTTAGTTYTLSVAANGASDLRVGRYNETTWAPNGSNSSAVFVFQLPDLGAIETPFTAVTFNFNIESTTGDFSLVLDGLGTRISSQVIAEDFRFADTHGTTAFTQLQNNILEPESTVGAKTSADIAAYMNTQYASGTHAGKYVFLRLATTGGTPDIYANAQNGYTITSANSGSNQPTLIYSAAIPEPTSLALLAGGLGLMALRRLRAGKA